MPPNPMGQSHTTIAASKAQSRTGQVSSPNEAGINRIDLTFGYLTEE
jgi:hypothetical protein